MFVSSCTEFRCMFINVSDLVFPFHSLAPVLREALAVFGNRVWRRVWLVLSTWWSTRAQFLFVS